MPLVVLLLLWGPSVMHDRHYPSRNFTSVFYDLPLCSYGRMNCWPVRSLLVFAVCVVGSSTTFPDAESLSFWACPRSTLAVRDPWPDPAYWCRLGLPVRLCP